jgi:hypothetical protein
MKQVNFKYGSAWFCPSQNEVSIGAGYEALELNKKEVIKLIAFLVKALARMK